MPPIETKESVPAQTITYTRGTHYRCQHIKDNNIQCGHTVNTRDWEVHDERICTHHRFQLARREGVKFEI